jgi:hypothetical protein
MQKMCSGDGSESRMRSLVQKMNSCEWENRYKTVTEIANFTDAAVVATYAILSGDNANRFCHDVEDKSPQSKYAGFSNNDWLRAFLVLINLKDLILRNAGKDLNRIEKMDFYLLRSKVKNDPIRESNAVSWYDATATASLDQTQIASVESAKSASAGIDVKQLIEDSSLNLSAIQLNRLNDSADTTADAPPLHKIFTGLLQDCAKGERTAPALPLEPEQTSEIAAKWMTHLEKRGMLVHDGVIDDLDRGAWSGVVDVDLDNEVHVDDNEDDWREDVFERTTKLQTEGLNTSHFHCPLPECCEFFGLDINAYYASSEDPAQRRFAIIDNADAHFMPYQIQGQYIPLQPMDM